MSAAEFDASVLDFAGKLRSFVRRRVRDEATADDLAQETLLKVYRSRATLRDGVRLEAWLYRIARRTIIDHYRRAARRDGDGAGAAAVSERGVGMERVERADGLRRGAATPPYMDVAAESVDEVAALREAVVISMKRFLEELPEEYREPVRLAELEGLPLAKIALRMDLSLTAVKSRVQRGRAMLKKKLQDCCRFEFDRQGKVIGWEKRQPKPCRC